MKPAAVHQKQTNFLKQAMALHRLSHAYLFVGEPEVGKEIVADWLIEQIRQQVNNSWDFQLWRIYPESSEALPGQKGRGVIKVKQIEEMRHRTDLRLGKEGYQVVVIHQAQLMNIQSQDLLLKVLEEPRNRTIFILLADYLEPIRDTVRSRCQVLYFSPLSHKQSINWLVKQGVDQERAGIIALLGQGRFGLMSRLKDDPKEVERRLDEWRQLKELQSQPMYQKFKFAEKAAQERAELSDLLNNWVTYWRAMLLIKSLGLRFDSGWSDEYNLSEIVAAIDKIEEVESIFRRVSLNRRLALEYILI